MSYRRSIPTPPTRANWQRARSDKFVVYRQPQDDSYTDEQGNLVPRNKRIDLTGITFVEEDAEGVVIPRGAEGFSEITTLQTEDIRDLAKAHPEVRRAYQEMIARLTAFYDAIYNAINN